MNTALDIQKIFSDIFTITNYQGDRQAFVASFIKTSFQKALIATIDLVPDEKREEYKTKLLETTTPQETHKVIFSYVKTEDYFRLLQLSSAELFQDFFATITPTLTNFQLVQLDSYMQQTTTAYQQAVTFQEAQEGRRD